ncbi:PREDICTED: E3 ubiquitin-protein ligase RMA1H1-like [Lupinus angustifolius]|uniref:E3 ubiquitin-protein ligase RMA1H1-like n=1 Tax=Lupinus angustifolius TaxID=3871 RepID=UPI00092FABD3|nr:PREDICTED: E3 ubiquitin-protein ligase RMA1H1-like [Lupinus angustifolius]
MASDQYFEEAMPQMDYIEDKSSPELWESANDTNADSDRNGGFDCNICLESVQDPVVTLCGHLYCWPCIYKWLNFDTFSSEYEEQHKTECPVCKSEISQSSLVPLYGRSQTTLPSSRKTRQEGIIIPRRPHGPSWLAGTSRSSNTASFSQPTSPVYHHQYHNHPQQFNSFPGSYTSPMINAGGSLTNTFNTTYGVFGEMLYSRVFGHQVSNTYPNSYNLSLDSNPRIRRQLIELDKSLNRVCFFLLCCIVLCLLLF